MSLSRRGFVGGLATVLGYAGLRPANVFGQAAARTAGSSAPYLTAAARARVAEYDPLAKMSSNGERGGAATAHR